MKTIISYIITGLFLCACDKVITPDFTAESKLVLRAFLSPQDEEHSILLTYSSPVTGPNVNSLMEIYVADASVILSDGTIEAVANYDNERKLYLISAIDFPIHAGKTYKIKATHAIGSVEGSTTVPLENTSLEAVLEKINEVPLDYTEYIMTTEWSELDDQGAGYRLFSELELKWEINGNIFSDYQTVTPEALEGTKKTLFLKGNQSYGFQTIFAQNYGEYTEKNLLVSLLNIDTHYLLYHKSLQNTITDDPFAEAIRTYGNVTGGLGVVGSYNRFEISIPLQ